MKTSLPAAICYVRWSTSVQEAGDSERRQREKAESWCKANAYKPEWYIDRGESAYHGRHRTGELGKIIDAAERGRYPKGTPLVLDALDRLTREDEETALLLSMSLRAAGMEIVDLKDYSPESRTGDRRYGERVGMLGIMGAMMEHYRAHAESERKSQMGSAAWKEKRKKLAEKKTLLTKKVPYGYKVVDGKITIVEDEANTVRLMFLWAAEELSPYAIAAKATKEGFIPRRAGMWRLSSVRRILSSRQYFGEFTAHTGSHKNKNRKSTGVVIKSYFPEIVPESLYNEARAALEKHRGESRSHRNGSTNLFTGLAKCSHCGKPLEIENKGKRSPWRLRCSYKCGAKPARRDDTEWTVLNALRAYIDPTVVNPDEDAEPPDFERQITALETRLKAAKTRVKKWSANLLDIETKAVRRAAEARVSEEQDAVVSMERELSKLALTRDTAASTTAAKEQAVRDFHGLAEAVLIPDRSKIVEYFAPRLDDEEYRYDPIPNPMGHIGPVHLQDEARVRMKTALRRLIERIEIEIPDGTVKIVLRDSGKVIETAMSECPKTRIAVYTLDVGTGRFC